MSGKNSSLSLWFFLKLEINLLWWERRENCLLIIYNFIGLRTLSLIFMGDCKVKVLTLITKQWTRFGKVWYTWSPSWWSYLVNAQTFFSSYTMGLGQQEFLPLRQDGWFQGSWEGGRAIPLEQSICDSQAGRGWWPLEKELIKHAKWIKVRTPKRYHVRLKLCE